VATRKNKGARKAKAPKFDSAQLQAGVQRQFRNLDSKDPSSWPLLPRALLCLAVVVAVAVVSWFVKLKDFEGDLASAKSKEQSLRTDYEGKLKKAVSLDALRQQREQVQQFVTQLEKQLPSKAEMASLLSDINQAGLGRSLQFELFRPGQVQVKDYYAELPIAIKVIGKFHDMGSFSADVAALSRIVTLNNMAITPQAQKGAGNLSMEVTARTFRYLDPDEIKEQQAKGGKKK